MRTQSHYDILILSANYGAGHNLVAHAVKDIINAYRTDLSVEIKDFFNFLAPRVNHVTKKSFIKIVRYFPNAYRVFFKLTGSIKPDSPVQHWLDNLGHERLAKLIQDIKPCIIICTFPTPAGVLSALSERGKDVPKVITIITDVIIHSQWIHPHTDIYIIPDKYSINKLIDRNIPTSCIHPLGIPLRPSFSKNCSCEQIRQNFGLSNKFTVLLMGGAYGMLGKESKICQLLGNLPEDIQIIIVCGHNRMLLKRMQNLKYRFRNKMHVLGFTEKIADLMQVSNLLISKAGGITVYEALSKGLPLLVYRPIPGQEEGNTNFLINIGAGKSFKNTKDLVNTVQYLYKTPASLKKMSDAALLHSKPNAVNDTVNLVLEMADAKKKSDEEEYHIAQTT
ncbi:MAG: glycosyltransferase [Clostridiales bacterium]|nr:glycosyltransferase [Clostridiales bacterium]MCF8021836.1 glycosyltransferase [Clostridiales bacterium]